MTTKTILTAALCLGVTILFIGCGGAAVNNATTSNTAAKNTAVVVSNTTPANSTTTTASNSTASDASKTDAAAAGTGVPECDEYIKKYEACLSKIAKASPQAEGPLKTSFEQQRNAFKTAAATAAGKATLSGTCKQAMDTAKTATKMYSCEW